MGWWSRLLTEWWRLPLQGSFAELDRQILKFRALKDSYARVVTPPFSEGDYSPKNR